MGVETGGKVFDPMGFSKIASAETLAWYRAAELKHSRIAMVRPPCTYPLLPVPVGSTQGGVRPLARNLVVACTLFCNQAAVTGWAWTASGGPLFPGYISASEGITFESLGRVGYAAWDATPENGKFQILGIIGILELLGEASVKPHYMSGGTPGKIPLLWDPLGFTSKLSPEALARKRNSELKNGWAAAPLPTRMHNLRPTHPLWLHPKSATEAPRGSSLACAPCRAGAWR